MAAKGLAVSTVQRCYQLLSKVMAAAVDAGMMPQTPCRRVPLPRIERKEMRFLCPAEVWKLADAIAPEYRALILLGAFGELRIGEMAGLRWGRVDLEAGRSSRIAPVRGRSLGRADGRAWRAGGAGVRRAAGWGAAGDAVPAALLAAGDPGGWVGRSAHSRPSAHGGGAVDCRWGEPPRRSRPGPAMPR